MSKKSAKFERLKSKYEDLVIEEDAVGIRLQLCCCAEDDDGVPPPCKAAHCPFSHENLCLNGEKARRCIGGIGLSHCDRYRKLWLGLVSWFSLLTLGLTIYGCCSLSDNRSVVRRTYWAAVDGHGFDGESSFSMYVGLTTFIYSNCTFVPGYLVYPKNCQEQIVYYKSAACTDGPLSSVCEACQGVATATWVAAVTNVLGLVLATNGAQIRMRRIADVPIQKLLGMVTDLIGAVTLAASLLDFRTTCFQNLDGVLNKDASSYTLWEGPGMICYAICAFSALLRAFVHSTVPIPEKTSLLEAAIASTKKRLAGGALYEAGNGGGEGEEAVVAELQKPIAKPLNSSQTATEMKVIASEGSALP